MREFTCFFVVIVFLPLAFTSVKQQQQQQQQLSLAEEALAAALKFKK